jgi:hypothetical protein
MRDAARALDDVSDHLGEVLRRADQLLAEWSGFGAQVRAQVEREAAAIGTTVERAVARAADAGFEQAIADRLRALTTELERLEQRTRAASRAVVERRDGDRRILWGVVAGIVLANALLVAVLLRRPAAPPAVEPFRVEATTAPLGAPGTGSAATAPAAGSGAGDPTLAGSAGSASGGAAEATAGSAAAGSNAPSAPAVSAGSGVPVKPGAVAGKASDATRPSPPVPLPPRAGLRVHKKP